MPLDLQNPLAGGRTAFAGLLYIGASLYVTGPLVGERTIARSAWDTACQALQRAELVGPETPRAFTPKFDCRSLLSWFGSEGRAVCDNHGNPTFDLPGLDALEAHRRHLREFQHAQLERKLADSKSRCGCAVTVTLERQRTSFALYAGTARLVTPPAIRNLSSELHSSLRSPLCAFASKEGGAS